MAYKKTSRTSRSKPRKKSYFLRGLFLLVFGFTIGIGTSAWFAATINKLPLPFTKPPTRGSADTYDSQRTRRETLEFHETLQRQEPKLVIEVEPAQPQNAPNFFYLQLGVFQSKESAEELRGQIAFLGEQAIVRQSGSNDAFRVWVGPYNSSADAEASRANLALQGFDEIQLLKFAEPQ